MNKYQWFCKWDLFWIENLNLLFINLLLMIKLYIPWEGEGGLWWKFEIKTQERTLSKNNNPAPLCPRFLIIWNIDIHTYLLDSTFLCPHLYYLKIKHWRVFTRSMGSSRKYSISIRKTNFFRTISQIDTNYKIIQCIRL